MSRILGRFASIFGVAFVTAVSATACTDDESESVFIRGLLAPPTTRTTGGCTYSADPSQGMLFEGRLDVLVSKTYTGVMLVGSQLSARGDQNTNRAESNRLNIREVEVEVTDSSGARRISAFTAPSSGLIDPQANNAASYGAVGATILDAKTTDALLESLTESGSSRTVLAFIRVKGTTLAGTEIKSGAFQFPIRVCRGCLVDRSTGYDPATGTVDCKQPLTLGTGTVMPCKPGQDEPTPCQFCIDTGECQK